jgi:23S rRNA (cytosine1962-C5)-methyltransferase
MQISTAGMDKLRNLAVDALQKVFKPGCLIERSDIASRQDEGLPERVETIHGSESGRIEFLEHGTRFLAEPTGGQKTGFYLDQKDLRREIRRLATGRRVLNLFSYTGSNGVAALQGGAVSVHHVDSSESALALCQTHAELNGLDGSKITIECADVFQYFNAAPASKYDMVILDPPALIKSQKDTESGRKAYHFLNRAAMRSLAEGGILVTSSCSSFFTEDDLAFTLRRASVQSGMSLSLLKMVRQSPDHPISIYFPEAAYLKSFLCKA